MVERAHYARLAEALSYPRPELSTLAGRAAEALAAPCPEAARAVATFREAITTLSPGRLEEVYSATFDLSPACCPYLGHHLFAESPKRAVLMVGLKQAYAKVGLEVGGELPDHLCLVLHYLALAKDEELLSDLRDQVLLPGLDKMLQALADNENAYASLLHAAYLVAQQEQQNASLSAQVWTSGPTDQTSPPAPPRPGEGSQPWRSPFPRREGGQGVRSEADWMASSDGAGRVGCSPEQAPPNQAHVGGTADA